MGLAISELDTLDATEHMALSRRRGTLRGGKILVFEMVTLLTICSIHQDYNKPYVPKRKRPPRRLCCSIQPLIPAGQWVWKQIDIFVQGLEVTNRRRRSPRLHKSIHGKSKQRSLMGNVVAYTTQLAARKGSRTNKPTISSTTP